MCRKHDGAARGGEFVDHVHETSGQPGVERSGRLVEDEQPGIGDQLGSDARALQLAAAHPADLDVP